MPIALYLVRRPEIHDIKCYDQLQKLVIKLENAKYINNKLIQQKEKSQLFR